MSDPTSTSIQLPSEFAGVLLRALVDAERSEINDGFISYGGARDTQSALEALAELDRLADQIAPTGTIEGSRSDIQP